MSVYSFDIIFTCFLNWILCEKRAYPTSFCIREIRNVATKNAVRISLNEICEKAEKKMVEIKTTTAYGLWHIGQRKLHKRAHISDSIGCATTVQFRRLLWSWAFRIASSNSNQFIEPYCKLNAKKTPSFGFSQFHSNLKSNYFVIIYSNEFILTTSTYYQAHPKSGEKINLIFSPFLTLQLAISSYLFLAINKKSYNYNWFSSFFHLSLSQFGSAFSDLTKLNNVAILSMFCFCDKLLLCSVVWASVWFLVSIMMIGSIAQHKSIFDGVKCRNRIKHPNRQNTAVSHSIQHSSKVKNTEHCSKCIVPFDRDDSHMCTSIITGCWNKLSIKILFSVQWCIAAAIRYCFSFRYFLSVAERAVYVFVYFVQWTVPVYKESGNSATFYVFFFHF